MCLSGYKIGEESEHGRIHGRTDPRIAEAGRREDNGPVGVATLHEIIAISAEEAIALKPGCADEIHAAIDEAFRGVDRSRAVRTTQRLPDVTAKAALEKDPTDKRKRQGPTR